MRPRSPREPGRGPAPKHEAPSPRTGETRPRLAPRGPGRRGPATDQLEGRNLVREALGTPGRVVRIYLDDRALPDQKLRDIVHRAEDQEIPIERVGRELLDRMAEGRIHNGVVGVARPLPELGAGEVLEGAWARGADPFLLLLDEVQYEQNLGAVLRTADAAGVHAVVIPTRRGAGLSPVVQRIAMGGAEHVPVVRESLTSVLARLRKEGIRVVGAVEDADAACFEVDLTGPIALVLGGEDKGVSPTVRSRCDALCRVPMRGHVPSLNVSATAAVLLYERMRQATLGPPAVTAGRQPALPDLAEADEEDLIEDLAAEDRVDAGQAWFEGEDEDGDEDDGEQ